MSVVHVQELHGLPAFTFPEPDVRQELPAAGTVAWRLGVDPYGDNHEETFEALWDRFAAAVDLGEVRALIIGPWGEVYEHDSGMVVQLLTDHRDRLTGLRGLFLGDLEMEEAEISWIEQSDITPLLEAFPLLVEFGVRGGTKLSFSGGRLEHLRRLVIESGGLPGEVVRAVAASEFPALEHLELWFGQEDYGATAEVGDLEPILTPGHHPALRHLGLRNSEFQDGIAAAVAASPVVDQLHTLDLSLGMLTDEGANALLAGRPLTHLKKLDLRHHYLTDEVVKRVRRALEPAGVQVDLSEPGDSWEDGDGTVYRYTAVGE
ncbi:STM4015 family protein [Streptomyces sp. NPDC058045]|uniref:STM4015 family protein n=1 Tax=Streptomyces sp. NPDC058045 TaxID=3346311 RepID=UPI0036EFF2DB